MKEALLQIKQDLGEDAMILKTRKLPKKLFTLGAQADIEVTAALDEAAPRQPAPPPITITNAGAYNRPRPEMPARPQPVKPAIPEPVRAAASRVAPGNAEKLKDADLCALREDIREVKNFLKTFAAPGEKAAASEEFDGQRGILYRQLTAAEILPELAMDIARGIAIDLPTGSADLEKKVAAAIRERFPVAGPLPKKNGGPLVVAFVGPTGSGKTTTLAKLAAHYVLERKSAVSIITADTYRIAAIEQIRAFAEIVKIGIQVVFAPDEAAEALAACGDSDIVFIDTAGRSQRNAAHMEELDQLLQAFKPDQIHLVLSATTKNSDLFEIVERHRRLGADRLLFTKLDETVCLGNIFNTVCRSRISASYFTTGQSVPDDIELAQPGRLMLRLRQRSAA